MKIWVEHYRPKTLDEVLIPDEQRLVFKQYIQSGLPNIILYGSPGTGKTTTALILIKELDTERCNHLRLNGSDERSIEVVRNEIKSFIQTKSFNAKRKIVFYDEAEALTPQALKALKELTERYQKTVSFIFCTNHLFVFPDAIRSRFNLFEFKKPTKEEAIRYLKNVLEKEAVKFEPESLDAVYRSCAGDLRRALNYLQLYSMSGELKLPEETFSEIWKIIKGGDLVTLKRFFAGHSVEWNGLYRFLFEKTEDPTKAILLAKYAYQSAFIVDQEINFCGFVAELKKLKQ